MAYYPVTNFAEGAKDAFARLRVSGPFTLFDSQKTYTSSSAFWETLTSGTGTTSFGTTVHEPLASQVILKTGLGNGDRAIRQTRQYWPYQPGKSQAIVITGVLSPSGYDGADNVRRLGYFDDFNGIGFMANGSTVAIFKRSFATSAVVDTVVPQSEWNVDKVDGTGPSLVVYSPTAANIFWMDLEWLGVGRVRYGIWGPDGNPILCHQIQNANSNSGVYMGTATLPIRYSITNTGTTTANHQMTDICSTVVSEGGFDLGRSRSRSYVTTGLGVGMSTSAYTNILSIRSATSFGTSGLAPRAAMRPSSFSILATLSNMTYEVAWEAQNASNSAAGWTAAGQNSPYQVNVEGWVSSGGQVLHTGYAISGVAGGLGTNAFSQAGQTQGSMEQIFPVALNLSGTQSTVLTLRARAIQGSGSAQASLDWLEYW